MVLDSEWRKYMKSAVENLNVLSARGHGLLSACHVILFSGIKLENDALA